jgi:VIT1/CCC1 family predicted Fe2+/Mn2+ transporter
VSDQQPRPAAGLAQAIHEVTERASVIVREEIELAKAEVTQKVTKLGKGAVIALAAGIFVIGALILILFGFAYLAYWAIPFPGDTANNQVFWGFFAVAAILLALAALAGLVAAKAFKAGTPPAPTMAIEEAKLIKETVSSERPGTTI